MRRPLQFAGVFVCVFLPIACSAGNGSTPPADAPAADLAEDTTAPDDAAPPSDRVAPPTDRGDAGTADRPRPTDGACPVAPTPMGTSRAGAMCTSDMQCGQGMECDTDFVSGYCSVDCVNNPSQACEAAQCGGNGGTCLSIGDGAAAVSFCAPTCNPTARTGAPGACRAGTVCTGWWYTHDTGDPDRTGCEYFCQSNAQCVSGMQCNSRTGECGETGTVVTRRADGEPCNPALDKDAPQCRGYCFQETDSDREGICGSLVNVAVTPDCPDLPMRIRAIAPADKNGRTDNLGLCIYRECTTNADCTAPLRCVPGEDGDPPVCTYPDPTMPGDAGVTPDAARRDAAVGG